MRFLATLALLTVSVSAQITTLPNTGCQNSANPLIAGQPRLGQTLSIASNQFPCTRPPSLAFVLLNAACTTIPFNFSCFSSGNPCSVLAPIDFAGSQPNRYTLQLPIPNNPSLVGQSVCVQGGCFATLGPACLSALNKAARITIQR